MRYYNLLVCLVLIALGGCKSCDDEVKPDPCANIPPTSADFVAIGYVDGYNLNECNYGKWLNVTERRWTTTPNLYKGAYSIFAPAQKFDSVIWKVGLDPRIFKKDTLSIVFPETGSVSITLVGYRKANLQCNPLDNGVDTVVKVFKIINWLDSFISKIPGKYEGYEEREPGRKRIIELIPRIDQYGDFRGLWISNFPVSNSIEAEKITSTTSSSDYFNNMNDLSFFDLRSGIGDLCYMAWIKNYDDGKIVIDYSQRKDASKSCCERIVKRFVGKKI